jgi:hypothetical protein
MARLVAYLLGSWRLSRMLYDLEEDGPYHILIWIRHLAGVYEDDDQKSEFAKAIICPYCVSVWVGFLFAVLSLNKYLFRLIVWPFAASAVVVLMHEMEGD